MIQQYWDTCTWNTERNDLDEVLPLFGLELRWRGGGSACVCPGDPGGWGGCGPP